MPDFTNKISKYGGYGFTESQEKGLDALSAWYYNKNSLAFVLKGRAGTGKTYMLKYFIDKIVKQPLCVTAPTHKALRQIERSTNKKGKTLQSLHGLRPNINLEDFDLHNIKFDALGVPTFNNYKLVVIDECSMVNADLHAFNMRRAKDLNIKILYVGDPMQLPPIEKKDNNIIDSPTFHIPDNYELTEIVRQDADNPLIKLLEIVVTDIQQNTTNFYSFLREHPALINDRGEGYKVFSNASEFVGTAIDVFKQKEFSDNPDFARIASWKNKTVMDYNTAIRNSVLPYFKKEGEGIELIDTNDLIIGYKTIVNEFNETTLINSEDYIVKSVTPREAEHGFKSYAVTLLPRHGGPETNVHVVDWRDKSFLVYYDKVKKFYFNALYATSNKASKWKDYFEYKNKHLCLITFPIRNGQDEIITSITKDLDYAFSLTTHKLQGSTIENTFVDVNDMLFYSTGKVVENSKFAPNATILRNKLIYTALSRTSKFANILLP